MAGTLLPQSSLYNIFVAKINPSRPPSVAYLTFLGGSGTDTSAGIGVDDSGNTYLVGNTTSANFPTTSTGYQTVPMTKGTQCPTVAPLCTSIFVSVLNASGSALTYGSYLSGTGDDVASGMTIDLIGDVFITGTTTSTTPADAPSTTDAFPATFIPQPYQTQPISNIQFFVTKVDTNLPSVGGIAYSTLFGGSTPAPPAACANNLPGCPHVGGGVAVDATGNIYFSGTTNFYNSGLGQYGNGTPGTDFPILNAYQPCLDTPPPTVLGTSNQCSPPAIPPPPAPQAYPTDAFVAKINPTAPAGTQLIFSTYLGGAGNDTSTAIALNSGATNLYLTGSTNSSNFILPTGSAAYQECLGVPPPNVLPCATPTQVPTNAYVAKMSNPSPSTTGTPNDVALTYFTYLGGSVTASGGPSTDNGLAIAVDSSNDALVTGSTNSTNFPITTSCAVLPCPIQSTLNGAQNAFFAQIEPTTTGQTGGSYVTYFGGNGVDRGTGIAVDPSQNTYFVGDTTSTNFQVEGYLQQNLSGTKDAFVVELGTANFLSITSPVVSPAEGASAGNAVTVTFTAANEGPDPATNITVMGQVSSGATFNSATAASGTCSTPSGSNVVCLIPTLQSGSTSTVVFSVTPSEPGTYQVTATTSNSNNINTSSKATANFTAGGFTLAINPLAQTVVAGLPATYGLSLAPQPVYGAIVSLSCGQVPTGAKCTFTSSSVTLNGPQAPALNITTTAQPVPIAKSRSWRGSLYALWLMVPGLAVWGLGAGSKRRRSRLLGWLALCVLFALVFLQPSCSSAQKQPPVSGTPTGTYTISVTATSGSYSHNQLISLTVTP